MKLKFIFFLSISINILFSLNNSLAQNGLFTGRLIDAETKEPIANAKISVEGEDFTTYSNAAGYFQVRGVNKVIKVTHVGYKTVTTELRAGTPNFLMPLPPERYLLQSLILEELVQVTGYDEPSNMTKEEIESRSGKNPEADLVASFPRNLEAFHVYLVYSLYKNKDSLISPFDLNIFFTINKLGELKVDSMQGEVQSPEIIRSIFENSPKWFPALQKGLAVSTSFEQELAYHPVMEVEQAEPKEGLQSFYETLDKSIKSKNPHKARRPCVEGVVYVQFDVETDGSLTNVTPVKGIGKKCDEIIIKAIKNSPKWNPAKQDGKAVHTQRVLPIRFVAN